VSSVLNGTREAKGAPVWQVGSTTWTARPVDDLRGADGPLAYREDMSTSEVEVRRSRRRRRTVSAYRAAGRTVVLIPARFTRAEEQQWVTTMLERLAKGERRRRPSDDQLAARASELSRRHLGGLAKPTSIRWVTNQSSRWGSCTPADGTIRISVRVKGMPAYVLDYVILHELAHLLAPGHGREFWSLLEGYPRLERARGYLEGVAATAGLDLADDSDDGELGQAALDFGPSD
jgi:predicted metal-dependent hydrolase